MSPWAVLLVPLSLVGVMTLLFLVDWLEARMTRPATLFSWVIRGRRISPDQAERVVANEAQRLIDRANSGLA